MATTAKKKAKPQVKAAPKQPTAIAQLDSLGVDKFCDLIESGQSQAEIARNLGIEKAVVTRWLAAEDQRSARAREARANSAESLYEMAHQNILAASDVFELSKAKEEAQHLRKWAGIRNPREYGDKVAVGGAEDLPPVQVHSMSNEALLAIASRDQSGN